MRLCDGAGNLRSLFDAGRQLESRVLATARIFSPHLIILDCQLETRQGIDIFTDLRANLDLCGVPIVFLAGSLTKEEAVSLKYASGFPVLCKPISRSELVESALRFAA